jgi:1-deoxy-D-xylulose-5-phosphate reductoisomerase
MQPTDRRPKNLFPRLDLGKARKLTFYPPDEKKFPGLGLAREACRLAGTATVVFNGANEVAVEAFLKREIRFLSIPVVVSKVMKNHRVISHPSLKEILAADSWSREEAKRLIHD